MTAEAETTTPATTAPLPEYDKAPTVALLPAAVCEQMSRAFPLGNDAKVIKRFEAPADPEGAYAHSVMGDTRQQILIIVGRHPYELMADRARRIASQALKESEFSNLGMSSTGGIFVIMDGEILTDAAKIERHQKECLFARAFLLTQSSL